MSEQQFYDQTLALAGIAQACLQVQGLARYGKIDQSIFDVCSASLFSFEAESVADVYGGEAALKSGLTCLSSYYFQPKSPTHAEIMRYSFQLTQLGKQLHKSAVLSQSLGQQLLAIDNNSERKGSDECVDEIAKVYSQLISPLKPRVIVSGEQGYLAQPQTAAKVRVCLLAGIRSVHLWLQKGGSRWQLLTAKRRYQNLAKQVLAEMV